MIVIFNIGIFLSFFLGILLLTKRNKSLPDKILSGWMFIIGIHLLSYFLYYQGYWTQYPHLIGVTVPFPLLHGPMLYLYVLYSLRNDKQMRTTDYLHFAPAVLAYAYMSKFYFFYSAAEKTSVDKGLTDDFGLFSSMLVGSFILSGFIYTILSYKKISRYKQLINANFSFDERINLDWLKYSIWGIGSVFFTVAVVTILRDGIGIIFPFNADLIFYSMIMLFVFCLGFFGIQHEDIFSNTATDNVEPLVEVKAESEYKKSGLKTEAAMKSHHDLLKVMDENKPYLDPKLTLSELALKVNISTNHLSQIINQYEQMNFHDFVNKHRVDEFIQRAKTNKNFSILAHAYDSGFNSKSSFNIVFKKHEGITPSQYLAEINKGQDISPN